MNDDVNEDTDWGDEVDQCFLGVQRPSFLFVSISRKKTRPPI